MLQARLSRPLMVLAVILPQPSHAQQDSTPAKDAPAVASQPVKLSDRPEDEAAILAVARAFTEAFNAGDAAKIAATFSPDGQIEAQDGSQTRGTEALTARYKALFEGTPGVKLDATIDSLTFHGPDTAIAEGGTLFIEPDGAAAPGRFRSVFVRRDGRWQTADIRDLPDVPLTPYEHLKELEWLVGEWVDEAGAATVHTTCAWDDNRSFLIRKFTIVEGGTNTFSGTQRIGWDAAGGQIKAWMFDSDGGHGESYWSHDGKDRWVGKSVSTLPDGRLASATQIITRTGPDSMTWASEDRTLGDEIVPDLAPITIVRKPPAPK